METPNADQSSTDTPGKSADSKGSGNNMKARVYVPLILWLAISNIIAFLMLMVAAPKAEDYAEQSLEQKRREHENIAPAVMPTDTPKNIHTLAPLGDTMIVLPRRMYDSAIITSAMTEYTSRSSGIVNIFEPFIGAMRPLQSILLLAFIAGYLGGSLHALASLLYYRSHEKLTNHWTLWYIARPLKGAITAVIFSFIIQAGLMTGVSGDSVINPIGIIALSLLVGMSAHDAMHRMGIVFSTFFNTHRHSTTSEKTGDVFYDSEGNAVVIYSDGTYGIYHKLPLKETSAENISEEAVKQLQNKK